MKTQEGESMGVEDISREENAVSSYGFILECLRDKRKLYEDCWRNAVH